MEKHKLPKDSVGGYRYNDAITFIENVEGVLEDEYFENANDGMRGLVASSPNELTRFKANVAITRADVKRQLIADAPVGNSITNTILRHPGGVRMKRLTSTNYTS